MLKFDPCGHTLSLESFVFGVEQAFGGGSAKHEIRASSLGTFCLTCPVRDPEKPCGQSFVHDVHHYKLAVRAQKTALYPSSPTSVWICCNLSWRVLFPSAGACRLRPHQNIRAGG